MFSPKLLCTLAVTATIILGSGCTATRRQRLTPGHDRMPDQTSGLLPSKRKEISVAVRTVAHQDELSSDLFDGSPRTESTPAGSVAWERAAPDSGLTLEMLEQLALANNPAIRQASSNAAKARGVRLQVGLKPNPTIGYFGEEIGNANAGGLHGGFVSQTFVRGEKLEWNQRVLNHDVNAVDRQLETQRQRILTDVRIAFFEALTAQRRTRLAEEFRSVAERAVAVAAEQLEARIGTRPDVLQSEIQLNEVELSIQEATFVRVAAWNELAALTGVADLDEQSLTGSFGEAIEPRDEESMFAEIIAASPQLASAQARVDRARANLQRQQVQPIPNVTAQFGAGGDDATGDTFANLQFSLPIPVHNKNQGNVRAAHAEYCAAVQNVERIRSLIRRNLARTMRKYNVANATVQRYETAILPRARETMDLMKEAREAGEFDFLRVLSARRAYFDANLRYVDALGTRAQANAELEGLLLSDGMSSVSEFEVGDDLRGQVLSGQ